MIGAAVYRLIAGQDGKMPETQGRLLHAAFFQIINNYSSEMAENIHSNVCFKPFTVSELFPLKKAESIGKCIFVQKGDVFHWRVAGLNENVLQACWQCLKDKSCRQAGFPCELNGL